MASNFLQQLTQSGALNVADPMKAYQNALMTKAAEEQMVSGRLDREGKLLAIGKGYLQRVKSIEEYPNYVDYMTNKLGVDKSIYPESFGSEEEFQDWKLTATTSADQLLKAKQGQEFSIHKVNEDGTTNELKVTQQQMKGLVDNGLIDESWKLGTVEGSPWKPVDRIKEEEDAKLGSEKSLENIKQINRESLESFKQNNRERLKELYGGSKDKEYAPDNQVYINRETGETKDVNVRDPNAIETAKSGGFDAIGPEDRGYGTAIGKSNAERETQINKESSAARTQITTLQTMDNLLDRFESGKLSKVGLTLQQYANSFGLPVDVSEMSGKEAFKAMGEQLALQARNQGEGMVLAGQMSDRDVQFLRDMNPQMITSKAGNKLLIKIRKTISKRQNEIAGHMREFKKSNKGIFDATSFDEYVDNKLSKTSIFGIPEGSKNIGTDRKTGLPVYETPDGKAVIPNF